jgi:ABC-type branched-subunit amino acid transport system substrate-binding protein
MGATAYLHSVNDQGGVFGRKVQLLSYDDGYDPQKAPGCFKRMTTENVFALGFFVGTPTAAVYLPMAQEAKIPVVGLFTGAQMLYEPLKHYIINVRASYYDETLEQVDKLWDVNVHKVGVIYQNDAFGKTVLEGVKRALERHHSAPVALGTFERNTVNVDPGLKDVMAARPQAVGEVFKWFAAAFWTGEPLRKSDERSPSAVAVPDFRYRVVAQVRFLGISLPISRTLGTIHKLSIRMFLRLAP